MNFLDILAGIISWLISAVLILMLINEIAKELYPERPSPLPCAALIAWALRRKLQRDAELPRRR